MYKRYVHEYIFCALAKLTPIGALSVVRLKGPNNWGGKAGAIRGQLMKGGPGP